MTDAAPLPTPEPPEPGGALELISDGDGLTVIGAPAEIERFLTSIRVDRSTTKDVSRRLRPMLSSAASLTLTAAQVSAESGRWVKLTAESAEKVQRLGLTPTTTPGVSHAMIGDRGSIESWIQIVTGPSSIAANPALLAGAAGVMAQIAMKQMMDEITDYLVTIDEKVDDILRAQKDAALADMIGASQMIDEAMTIRDQVGRVGEVTWSKVQATALTLARTQAYALRQLDALAEKLERKSEMGELASVAKDAEARVHEWLAVLAQCVRLQDGVAILELDRVLDASPEELNDHRMGLRIAREKRLGLIARCTVQLIDRMNAAAERANAGVLVHPIASPSIVRSTSVVTSGVAEFHGRLGLTSDTAALEARRWTAAAADAWDTAKKVSADGLDTVSRVGAHTVQAFKAIDLDGDGLPDKPRALTALSDTRANIADAATNVAGTASGVATRAAGALSSRFRRKSAEPGLREDAGQELELSTEPEEGELS